MMQLLPEIAALADRYAIDREIGRGGMATVYLAEDRTQRCQVAIKVLSAELATALGHKRFLREIEIAAKLTHPHIVSLLDSGDAGGSLFYVMPYASDESLRRRLDREGQLAIEDAVRVACEVASALDYAHRIGVVHRDVKPENILFSNGRAVVADFGIAAAISQVAGDRLTSIGLAVGTPTYMSPEQASAERVDGRSDIYSLCCVLYEMLAGEPPFTGPTAQSVIAKRMSRPAPSIRVVREAVPEALDRVLRRALSRTPADRYRTADTLQRALEAAEAQRLDALRPDTRQASPGDRSTATEKVTRRGESRRIASIAVLPFENLSSNTTQEYYVAGIHDAIMGELARIGALRVASRTSVAPYRGSGMTIPEIARKLKVDAVVEGSVLSAGDAVRVHVELIRGSRREERIWGQTYDRAQRDVLALHSEVARAVAEEIRIELTPEERSRLRAPRSVDPEAYRHYLIGNFHLAKNTEAAFRQALDHYAQAIAIDGDYAPAYAGQAVAYLELGSWASSQPPSAVSAQARTAALIALERDPTLAEAHIALARIKQLFEWDWPGAEAEFRRGIGLNPKAMYALMAHANYEVSVGRFELSAAIGRRARELDPVYADAYFTVGLALHHMGRNSEALKEFDKAIELAPNDLSPVLELAQIYAEIGRHDEAADHAERVERALAGGGPPAWLARLATAYAIANRPADARRILDQLAKRDGYVPPTCPAVILAALGETEAALDLLEDAYEKRDVIMAWMKVRHHFDPLRGEPRFKDLLRRMNFPA
jgi:eukaryotic-like serine/threonine-protein kinase